MKTLGRRFCTKIHDQKANQICKDGVANGFLCDLSYLSWKNPEAVGS